MKKRIHLSWRNKEMSKYYVFDIKKNDLIEKSNESEVIIIDNKTEAEIKKIGENHYRVKIEQGRGAAHHPIYLWNVNVYDNKIICERIRNYDEKVRLFGLGFLSSIAVVVGIGLIPKLIGFFMVGSSIDFQMVLVGFFYIGFVYYLYHSWKVTYKINSKIYIEKFIEIVSEWRN